MRPGDEVAKLHLHRFGHADVAQIGELGGGVEDAHDHLLPGDAARGGDAELDEAVGHLGGEAAVLRFTFLRDVEVADHLEDVDDAVPHRAVERRNVDHHAVDAEAHRHLVHGRFEVDVGGPAPQRVPDHFESAFVALRLLDAIDAILVFHFAVGPRSAHEAHRDAGGSFFLDGRALFLHADAEISLSEPAKMGFVEELVFFVGPFVALGHVAEAGETDAEPKEHARQPEGGDGPHHQRSRPCRRAAAARSRESHRSCSGVRRDRPRRRA